MKTIASFTVNHDTLKEGMYVSRIDGDVVTYDIRMKLPNGGDYLPTPPPTPSSISSPPMPATVVFRIRWSTWAPWAVGRAFISLFATR